LLAANGANGTIRLWNVTDPTHPAPLTTLPGNPNNLNTVAFSPDSRTLAIPGAGQTIQLWDLTFPASLPHGAVHSVSVDIPNPARIRAAGS
jgi:WD40 repeat protein